MLQYILLLTPACFEIPDVLKYVYFLRVFFFDDNDKIVIAILANILLVSHIFRSSRS